MPPMADSDEPDIPQFQVQQPRGANNYHHNHHNNNHHHHPRTTNSSYVD